MVAIATLFVIPGNVCLICHLFDLLIYFDLIQVICTFGCPTVIISDQGREFVNRITNALFQKTQTQHRITSAYHPQVNCIYSYLVKIYYT